MQLYKFASSVAAVTIRLEKYKHTVSMLGIMSIALNMKVPLGRHFNPKGINDGDSVWLKYAVEDPRLIITELEKAY